jgi:hypothetical protein
LRDVNFRHGETKMSLKVNERWDPAASMRVKDPSEVREIEVVRCWQGFVACGLQELTHHITCPIPQSRGCCSKLRPMFKSWGSKLETLSGTEEFRCFKDKKLAPFQLLLTYEAIYIYTLEDLVFLTLMEANINRMFCSLKYNLFLVTLSRKSKYIFNVLLIVYLNFLQSFLALLCLLCIPLYNHFILSLIRLYLSKIFEVFVKRKVGGLRIDIGHNYYVALHKNSLVI